MANKKIESLTEIKEAVAATSAVAETKRKPSRDKQGRSYATGKRKNAVARVWIMPGKGNITINEKPVDTYFARPVLKMIINQPFEITNRENEFDVVCTDEVTPWSHMDYGVTHEYLVREYNKALAAQTTQPCNRACHGCGANHLLGGPCFDYSQNLV